VNREQLEAFARVAEHRSFERAASTLSITRGAVSQRIKALEESLSSVLLMRDNPVVPTRAGEVLLRHVQTVRLLENTTLRQLRGDDAPLMPIPVAIAVDADSLATWFSDVLPLLLSTRRMAIEIIADSPTQTFNRLKRGEVMGCIASEPKAGRGFVAEPLGEMHYRCVASPTFAAAHFSAGFTVAAATAAAAVVSGRGDPLHDDFLKATFGFRVDSYLRHCIPSSSVLMNAIVSGCGYGLVPAARAKPLMDAGHLVEPVPDHLVCMPLHWHRWESELEPAREISQLIVRHTRRVLASAAGTPTGVT
jgi:LysR family transcriptional regulator (chromosome initiation inhibitor)